MGGLHEQFNLLDGQNDATEPNPFEGGLTTVRHLSFVDQADGLQHVGDIIQSSDLGLE